MLLASQLAFHLWSSTLNAFDTFEHRYIGNLAFHKATRTLDTNSRLHQDLSELMRVMSVMNSKSSFLSKVPLEFGDLSAFAGDFVNTPEELGILLHGKPSFRENLDWILRWDFRLAATRKQWANACRWLHDSRLDIKSKRAQDLGSLNDCISTYLAKGDQDFQGELNTGPINRIYQTASPGYTPTRKELAEFEKLSGYADIASQNRGHFTPYSWKIYATHHTHALTLARCYASLTAETNHAQTGITIIKEPIAGRVCVGDHEYYIKMAILYEGFAQHFLQDSFASGHMGSPYSECLTDNPLFSLTLLPPILCFPTKDYLQSTHDSLNGFGIVVKIEEIPDELFEDLKSQNSRTRIVKAMSDGWTAFGDDHLLIPEAALQRAIVIAYATLSIREVLSAAQGERVKCNLCSHSRFPQLPESQTTRITEEYPLVSDSHSWLAPLATGWDYYDSRVQEPTLEGWKVLAAY